METSRTIDVASLDLAHPQAIEDVIGVQLQANQRLTIEIGESPAIESEESRPPTLEDWQSLYDGLTDEEIEKIDRIINTRPNLTRYLP